MFPAMNYLGMMAAISLCAATRIFAGIDAGLFGDGKPAPYVPLTNQQALDVVCAQVQARKAPDLLFSVAVTYSTHDALKGGITVLGTRFVTVLTDTDTDAQLVAAQMVACRGFTPTGTLVTDVIA